MYPAEIRNDMPFWGKTQIQKITNQYTAVSQLEPFAHLTSRRVVLTTLIEILTEIMVRATPLGFIVSWAVSSVKGGSNRRRRRYAAGRKALVG